MRIIIFLLLSTGAFAQSDTSKQVIRLQFMQKHIAYMGAQLARNNTINDRRIHDTLSTRIGSATVPDSVTIGGYPAGFVLRFFNLLMDEYTGTAYDYFRELATGKPGYPGIVQQLNAQINNGNLSALWLRTRLQEAMATREAVLTERLINGAIYLKTPIE